MSYEIDECAALGLEVAKIARSVSESKVLKLYSYGSALQLNHDFIESYGSLHTQFPDIFTASPAELSAIAIDEYISDVDRGRTRVLENVIKALFYLAGMKTDALSEWTEPRFNALGWDVHLIAYGDFFVPAKGGRCPGGFTYLFSKNYILNDWILPLVAKTHSLQTFKFGWSEDPVFSVGVKKSLEKLLAAQRATAEESCNYGPESFIHFLLQSYLEQEGIITDTSVCSTRYGDALELGGMKRDAPYLLIGAGFDDIGLEGWEDPREDEETNSAIEAIENVLLGKAAKRKSGFEVLTPTFGG